MSATAERTSSERPRSTKDGTGASEGVVSNSVTLVEVKMVHFRAASGSSGTRHGCARQTVRAVGSICTSGARAGPRGGACSPTALTRTRGADSTAGKYTGCRCAIWGRVQITHQPNRLIVCIGIPPLQNRPTKRQPPLAVCAIWPHVQFAPVPKLHIPGIDTPGGWGILRLDNATKGAAHGSPDIRCTRHDLCGVPGTCRPRRGQPRGRLERRRESARRLHGRRLRRKRRRRRWR